MPIFKDPEQLEKKRLHQLADLQDKRILEIGCGEGRLTWRYAPASSLTIGLDIDQNALRVARYDCPTDHTKKILFTNASAEHIPFRKHTFDIAILAWSL